MQQKIRQMVVKLQNFVLYKFIYAYVSITNTLIYSRDRKNRRLKCSFFWSLE